MTRLTIDLKDQIGRNAVDKAGIPEKLEELKRRRADWVERVRLEYLGGPAVAKKLLAIEKRFIKAVAELPRGVRPEHIFHRRTGVYVKVNGMQSCYYFAGRFEGDEEDEVSQIAPYEIILKAKNPLSAEFLEIETFEDDIEAERRNVKANVRAALNKITTIKKLLLVWPEAKELLPEDLAPKSLLPAIRKEDLNAMIGLPSPKELTKK